MVTATTTTIVSAYFHIKNAKDSNKNYIHLGQQLLRMNAPKVIFIDKKVYEVCMMDHDFPLTHFIPIDQTDIYFYEHAALYDRFNLDSDNPKKDVLEYMFLMNHKTEWVRQAIELNVFQTRHFVWMDFGLFHVFKNDAERFQQEVMRVSTLEYPLVRIPSIWPISLPLSVDIYKKITWYFAGGVFGGGAEKLVELAALVRKKCIDILLDTRHLMWEVNVWYLVYLERPDLFDVYGGCDHNHTLLSRY